MDSHRGERHYCQLDAVRKGRGRSPCTIKAGVSLEDDRSVVLRTLDRSGVASLVALLTPDQAWELAEALMLAAEAQSVRE